MKVLICLFLSLLVCLTFVSCSESSSTSPDKSPSKVDDILGMNSSHSNLYQVFDNTIIYTPYYQVKTDTSLLTLDIIEVDTTRTRYDIQIDDQKLARFLITSNSVAMIGFYKKIESRDSLFYFINPPEVMLSRMAVDDNWEFYVPPIIRDEIERIAVFLNFGFGYDITRTYLGKQEIVVPAGSFNAHRVRTEYRLPQTERLLRTDIEYLVEGIGLVRMYSSGYYGSSDVVLIESNSESD